MLFPVAWCTLCTWKLESLYIVQKIKANHSPSPPPSSVQVPWTEEPGPLRVPSGWFTRRAPWLLPELRKDKIKNSLPSQDIIRTWHVRTCSDLWVSRVPKEMKGYQGSLFFFQQKFSLLLGDISLNQHLPIVHRNNGIPDISENSPLISINGNFIFCSGSNPEARHHTQGPLIMLFTTEQNWQKQGASCSSPGIWHDQWPPLPTPPILFRAPWQYHELPELGALWSLCVKHTIKWVKLYYARSRGRGEYID